MATAVVNSGRMLSGCWQDARAAAATLLYQYWILLFDRLSVGDKRKIYDQLAAVVDIPPLLVVIRIDRLSQKYVEPGLRRLENQLFKRWKAVLSFDATCEESFIRRIESSVQAIPGIAIARPDPDRETRQALDAFCDTDWMLVMAAGVLLRPHALYMFAMAAAENPGATLIYADEDRLNRFGLRCDPYFKAQFSPELARNDWYIGPCVLIRGARNEGAATIIRIAAYQNAIAWLRQMAQARSSGTALRIPFVLYHDALAPRPGDKAISAMASDDSLPRVSIIIPTKDRIDLLEPCLGSIEALTAYPRAKTEIIVVDNGSSDQRTLTYLSALARVGTIRLLRDSRPFNYPEINNAAAATATGDVLVFLNNDTEIIDGNWLCRLVEFAWQDTVGVVGMKLLYPDRTVQHGGIVLGIFGRARHAHLGLQPDEPGYHGLATLTHEVSAVTGACLAVRASIFREVGGFDPALRLAFNDVLFCLNVLERGYRNIYIGDPMVVHHESKTRGKNSSREQVAFYHQEARYARERHPGLFLDDPYYNPNLSLRRVYGLAFPPRRIKPWRRPAKNLRHAVSDSPAEFAQVDHRGQL